MFDDTIKLYREAVSFLIGCFNKEWLTIQSVDKAKAKFNFAEKLVHTTKHNTAKYDFDAKFYKFPSYLRRAAIQAALLKPLPVMVRSQLSAKVPEAERRILVTLATLKVLYPEYQKLTAQAA